MRRIIVALAAAALLAAGLAVPAAANEAALNYRTESQASAIAFEESGTWYVFEFGRRETPSNVFESIMAGASFGTTFCTGNNHGTSPTYPLDMRFNGSGATVSTVIPMNCYDWTTDTLTYPVVTIDLSVETHGQPKVTVETVTGYDEMIDGRFVRTTKSTAAYATGAHLTWDLPGAEAVPPPFLGDEAYVVSRTSHSVYPQGEA